MPIARMPELATPAQFARLDSWEANLCLRSNQLARIPAVRHYFSIASRLGDGIAWFALLVTLPLVLGPSALQPSLHMILTAATGILVYKLIKSVLNRERPFASHRGVKALLPPLDRYSFPSGHTMHAVAFTVMLAHYYPVLLIIVLPFALSVALSRVVLGLHYPTDVLAGAALGGLLAFASLLVYP